MGFFQSFFVENSVWAWAILGLILMGIEIAAPGTFLLWFGIAAILVSLLSALVDLNWQAELLMFIIFSVVLVMVGRAWYARAQLKNEPASELNARAHQLQGRIFTLEEPIVDGFGRVKVGDSYWRIAGTDLRAGLKVRVIGADGNLLNVEPCDT